MDRFSVEVLDSGWVTVGDLRASPPCNPFGKSLRRGAVR